MFTTISKPQDLESFVGGLNDFLHWLLSCTGAKPSLSVLAERICHFFSIEYCSIHLRTEGKWHLVTGSFTDDSDNELPDSLKICGDHPLNAQELADEQTLNVRNFSIPFSTDCAGLLVVKSDSLSNDSVQTIAALIALFMKGSAEN